MPSHSLATSLSTSEDWASPADRQAAARQAYRRSVADGRPLTGVELAKQFGLSPRWGTSRIAEVRADDIGRLGGSNPDRAGSPIGNSGNGSHPIARSASGPISNNGISSASPNGSHRDDTYAGGRPGRVVRQAADTPRTDDAEATAAERSTGPAGRGRSGLDTAITLLVAAVAFAASYGHMLDVALMAGEHPWIAGAFPITVDGLVLAALRRGEEGRGWLALGAGASIAANVLAQFPEQAAAAGPVVAAWPPLALYGTHRLLHGRRPPKPTATGASPSAADPIKRRSPGR